MKQFWLLLLVKVVSGSLGDSFDLCFSQNGLVDGETIVYYSERCRSFKKALSCMSKAADTTYLSSFEQYAATQTIDQMKTNVGKSYREDREESQNFQMSLAGALARVQYCSATYLKEQMKGCVFGFSTFSLDNITKEYAKSHYGSLVTALNCMTRKLQICPDDEHIWTYNEGIKTWRSQLDQLAPKGPGWKRTTTYGYAPEWTYNGGTMHFSITPIVLTTLVMVVF